MAEQAPPTYNDAFPALRGGGSGAAAAAAAPSAPAIRRPAVAKIASQKEQLIFDIPYEEQRYKVAEGAFPSKTGDVLRDIERKTDVKVEANTKKDRALTISIRGRRENIQEAKKLVLRELQTQANLPVQIPKDHHKFIMGPKGAKIKEIQDRFATRVNIPKADDPSDVITITGTTENCRLTAAELQRISAERSKSDSQSLPIPKPYHPLIAGYQNTTIKRVEEMTGAKIHVPPPSVEKDEIQVRGDKEAVRRAVMELEKIYNEKRTTCGELTAQVKKAQHRFVIGPKGSNLQEIMEKTGVVIEVPPPENDSDTIILRGAQTQLVVALQMVYEKANSVVLQTIKIPGWLHKHVIGPKGANLKSINESYPKVHVQFKEDSDEVEIEGPPAEVQVVMAQLAKVGSDLASNMTFAIVKCDPQFHRHIVGQKGATIKQIKEETGAQVNVPPDEKKSDEIRVEGSPEAVKAAKARLEQMVKRLANERSLDMHIDQKWHSLIIGQKGGTIKEITQKYPSVSINFPRKNEDSNTVNLRGDKAEVEAVEKQFKQLVKKIQAENFELEVQIFRPFHREIIGKNGSTIAKIREETHTRINVPAADEGKDTITVIGTEENCKKAQQMMLAIQDQVAKIETKEVPIPSKLHPYIIGPKGRVVASLSEEFGVQIVFPSGKAKTDKPDIVTVKGASESVAKCVAKLKEMGAAGEENHHMEDLKVPHKYHRFLIGKGGQNLSKLMADTGVVRILFPPTKKDSKPKESSEQPAADGAKGGKDVGKAGKGAKAAEGSAKAAEGSAAAAGNDEQDTVTLIGKKEACAKARAQIEERVKELDTVVEETIEVDPKHHKILASRNAPFMRSVYDEFPEIKLVVPKAPAEGQEQTDNKVQIKGPKNSVAGAIDKIKEHLDFVERSVTETMNVPANSIPSILGAKGANVQQMTATHNVNIKIPDRESRKEGETEVTLTLSGLPEGIAAAKAEIVSLLPVSEEIPLPASMHRFVIGKKGAGISKIQEDFNVRLEIPRPEEARDVIVVRGKQENIAKVRKHLEDRMPEFRDSLEKAHQEQVTVDPKYHRQLIGPGGSLVNKLRANHDVMIDFPRENSEQKDVIVLTGYPDKCQACKEEILQLVKEYESEVTKPVEIHHSVHGRIIGSKGSGVRKMQEDFKVRINFPSDKTSNTLEVSGAAENVDSCIERLKLIEEEFAEEIAEYEETQKYIKVTPQEKPAAPSNAPFVVRDAPWESSAEAAKSFPTLPTSAAGADGAAAPPAKPLSGVWGARR